MGYETPAGRTQPTTPRRNIPAPATIFVTVNHRRNGFREVGRLLFDGNPAGWSERPTGLPSENKL